MSDAMAELYPPQAENMRVVIGLPAPRKSRTIQPSFNRGSFESFYAPQCVIHRLALPGSGETIAAIDKEFPHARFDLMYIVADDEIRCAPTELSDQCLRTMLSAVPVFVSYVCDPEISHRFGLDGCELTFGFNFDRDTTDRDNGQYFDKRFHLHFNCWAPQDLANARAIPFGQLTDAAVRRSMIDPISFLGPMVLYDTLRTRQVDGEFHGARVLPCDPQRDVELGLPLGLKVELPDWAYLNSGDCRNLVRDLHLAAVQAYRRVHVAFTAVEPPATEWHRPTLLDVDRVVERVTAMRDLSIGTRSMLIALRRALRDTSARHLAACRSAPDLAASTLALAGLDYHLGFFARRPAVAGAGRRGERVYLYLQFKLFSRVGGGPAVAGASAVRVDRVGGPRYTDQQFALRREFQTGFVERHLASPVWRSTPTLPGSAALDPTALDFAKAHEAKP